MRFIDPKTDFAFKRIFGRDDSKEVLISFIDAALKLEGDRRIQSVKIENPYQVSHLPFEKGSVVDVACIDKMDVRYLVEMQVEKVQGFANRMIYNLSKCYSGQLSKGQNYPALNDVVLISVMDFTLFEKLNHHHSLFVLKDVETNYTPFNQLRLCCLELTKFQKTEEQLSGMLDKWVYFLKQAEKLEMRPTVLGEEIFDEVFENAEVANLSRKERDAYDAALQEVRDKSGMIAEGEAKGRAKGIREGEAKGRAKGIREGEAKGRAKGRAEGRAEGKAEGIREVAVKLLKKGAEIDHVVEVTGLSKDELKKIQQRMQE